MISNSRSGNNKTGLGYSKKDDKKPVRPVFVKVTNQKPSSRSVSPKSKTFINRPHHKPKVTKAEPKDKQVYMEKRTHQNGQKIFRYDNHRHFFS